jgi:hypothetical protein
LDESWLPVNSISMAIAILTDVPTHNTEATPEEHNLVNGSVYELDCRDAPILEGDGMLLNSCAESKGDESQHDAFRESHCGWRDGLDYQLDKIDDPKFAIRPRAFIR